MKRMAELGSTSTPIVEVSSSSDDEGMPPHFPECVRPYFKWTNMASRIQECLDSSRNGHCIDCRLASPGCNPQSWIDIVINHGLSVFRGDVCFKIGISYCPAARFQYYDYCRLPLMVVTLVSEQCDFIAQQETDALARYRKLSRDGCAVNACGDNRCMNRAPGGESHGHGISPPLFVLCVFGRRTQFNQRRSSD